LEGTIAVARAAKQAGVERFVFASSCSMYGAAGTDAVLAEDAPLRPLTPYAESKVRAEEALSLLADAHFTVVSMRNATVYGASPRLRLDIVLNNLAAWAVTTGTIRLLSDGNAWRPLVHVRDVAVVTDLLLRAPSSVVSGEAFNVGSNDQNYRVRELAHVLSTVTGCDVQVSDEAITDARSYRVDFSKLSRAFPKLTFGWDARRGAEELVGAFRSEGLTTDLFEGSRYFRLRHLKKLQAAGILDTELRSANARHVTLYHKPAM
jgi:nucleoside-diphosphate-sugar epimerase